MLQKRINTQSHHQGLQLSSPEDGCCPGADLTGCLYRFSWGTLPTTFESITIEGVVVPFIHTFTTTGALYAALYDLFTGSTNAGGLGVLVHENDISVYFDSFIGIAGNTDLTIEFVSSFPITAIVTNLGSQATETAVCDQVNLCLFKLQYELTEDLKIVINNVIVNDEAFATGALLRTGIAANISTASMTADVISKVRIPATGTIMDLWLWVREGWIVYVNGVKKTRVNCQSKFLNQ